MKYQLYWIENTIYEDFRDGEGFNIKKYVESLTPKGRHIYGTLESDDGFEAEVELHLVFHADTLDEAKQVVRKFIEEYNRPIEVWSLIQSQVVWTEEDLEL